MSKRRQLQLFLHGGCVLVLAALCGFPYNLAIAREWGEEAVRAWRLAHIGPAVTGIWLIAVAGAAHLLRLSGGAAGVCVWSLAASGYSFATAAALAALWGVRGLDPVGPFTNLVVYAGYTVGAVGGMLGLVVILAGAWASLRLEKGS